MLIGFPQCGHGFVFVFFVSTNNFIIYSPVPQAGEKEYWGTTRYPYKFNFGCKEKDYRLTERLVEGLILCYFQKIFMI